MTKASPPPGGAPQGPVHTEVPDGDERPRQVCRDCGFIHYENPKVVTGAVVVWQPDDADAARILLCRRAIAPRIGFWTLPAGYLELGETTEDGAVREAREEACAEIGIDRLLAVYNVARISQVQTIYRARLLSRDVAAGAESLEVGLFDRASIPWDEIAFPTVRWALEQYFETEGRDDFPPFGNPPDASVEIS